jgi:hypothetical protein
MRRFDQADLFDHLAEARLLSAATRTGHAEDIAGSLRHIEITTWSLGAASFRHPLRYP